MDLPTQCVDKNRIETDGVSLAYEDYGGGPPVVFLHGFPTSTFTWSRVAGPLSAEYRCVSFDLMGFGDSDKPIGETYSIPRHADLVWQAVRQLGIERPVLAGHSMGGGVCLEIARRVGDGREGVAGLFLANSACYRQRLPWFFKALRIPLLPQFLLRRIPPGLAYLIVRDTAYHRSSGMRLEDMLGYILNVQTPGAAEAFVATARDIATGNMDELIECYPSLPMPAQIIWGRQDRVIPFQYGERLCTELGNAKLHAVDNCGHTPQEEHPEETLTLIRQFLQEAFEAVSAKHCPP